MKKIMCFFLFIFVFLFLNVVDVNAASLSMKDLTLECIYSDGGLYTSSFSGTDDNGKDEYIVNRTSYNVEGVDNNSANKGSATYVVNNSANGDKCHSKLYVTTVNLAGTYKGDEETGDSDSPVDYHKFGAKLEPKDIGASNSWWDYLWPGRGGDADRIDDANAKEYVLLSERYQIYTSAPEPNTTIYYMQEAKQAVGSNSYIAISVYDNLILMEKDGITTRLEGDYSLFNGISRGDDNKLSQDVPNEIYINSPEPQVSTSSASTISYKFQTGQIVYSVSKIEDSTHINKYTLTDEIDASNLKGSGALCDEILVNTSPLLSQVIKGVQLLVPVFLIVLTAFDIGKIVIAGNIEEELPKRKKVITIRFIVAITFFFLPLFVRMITGWLIDSGAENTDSIEYIDCLFR